MKPKNNFIKNLNILDGTIIYNDFDIDENTPFEEQKYSYKQDMLQIGFGKRFVVDIGWLPDFKPNGYFVVQAIQDYDWMNPLFKTKCRTFDELKKAIETAVIIIDKTRKIKDLPNRNIFSDEELK